MVCDNTTLRSSGARGLDVSRCYRHIAPLERKAPMHQNSRCVMHRRGGVASPDGLGQPTPTGSRVCDNTILRSSGARGLDVSRCYRHVAPLGLKGTNTPKFKVSRAIDIAPLERKAPMHQNSRDGIHRRGGVASPDGLGQPTPTGSRVCDNTTLRSSGARGLDVSRCYRHIAPLERKAPMHQNSRCVMHRRGGVASPERVGAPNAYGFKGVRQYHIALLWGWTCRAAIDISLLWRKAKPNAESVLIRDSDKGAHVASRGL